MNFRVMDIQPDMWAEIRESEIYPYYTYGNTVYKVVKLSDSKKDDDGYVLQPISDYCRVCEVFTSIETKHKWVSVEYFDSSTGELIQTPAFPRIYLSDNKLQNLMNYGISYHQLYKQDFSNYLARSECTAQTKLTHSSIGYREVDGGLVFLMDKAIGHPLVDSTYINTKIDLSPCGELNEVLYAIENCVLGQAGGEITILSSLGAAILPLLPYEMTDGQSLILSLAGDSSKDKTTIAKFASSFWTSPTNGILFHDSYSTENSLIACLENTNGVCHVFDEREEFKKTGMSSEIYLLAGGSGKSRLDSTGKQQRIGKFQDTIIFTSEMMFSSSKAKAGQLLRFIELDDTLPLVKNDYKAVEYLVGVSHNHYGLLGRCFASRLLEMDKRKLIANYKKYRELILNKLPKNGYSSRISKKYAIILLAGYFTNEFYDLSFDLDRILDTFVEVEEKLRTSRETHERALDIIRAFMAKNSAHFDESSRQCYGKFLDETSGNVLVTDNFEVVILKQVLDELLVKHGFNNIKK